MAVSERHYVSLGITNTPINRKLAQEQAFQIQRDIEYGEFDPTYERYRVQSALTTVSPPSTIPVSLPKLPELWARYVEAKRSGLQQQFERERREQEISDATRKIRALADKFNSKSSELADLYRQIVELDPNRKILQSDEDFKHGTLSFPCFIYGIGSPVVKLMRALNLSDFAGERNRGFDKKLIERLQGEFRK